MSVYLSQRDALMRARQAGELIARVYGPPDLVVGIRRAGLPVAIAFAQGARARHTRFVARRAPADAGTTGVLVRWGRRLVPRRLRQLGRSVLYRPVMQARMRMHTPGPAPAAAFEDLDPVGELLRSRPAQLVVVVDDAVDSGVTMRLVVEALEALNGGHSILPFALASTLGLRVRDRQLHVFEDVVEFIEGDLGGLDEQATAEILAGLQAMPHDCWRTDTVVAEVDLADLLTRAPHECIARALIDALETGGHRLAALRLRCRCLPWRLRRASGTAVTRILESELQSLTGSARESFESRLTAEVDAAVQPVIRTLLARGRLDLRVRVESPRILTPCVERVFGTATAIEVAARPRYPAIRESGLAALLDGLAR